MHSVKETSCPVHGTVMGENTAVFFPGCQVMKSSSGYYSLRRRYIYYTKHAGSFIAADLTSISSVRYLLSIVAVRSWSPSIQGPRLNIAMFV